MLDLYITEEAYLTQILSEGIDKLLTDKDIAARKEFYLTNYATENMKDFVQNILHKVIQSKL